MNGIASTSMRKRGLDYKLNFGLKTNQIKELAANYKADADLAQTLWLEDTRELKILATHLYPIQEFTEEIADRWVTEINNHEIREQACLNLFQQLPFAVSAAKKWCNSEDTNIRTTGYSLLTRLYLSKKLGKSLPVDNFEYIWEDAVTENNFLRNAALSTLKQIGRQSKEEAEIILSNLSVYKNDENLMKQEAYNSVAFEFEYFSFGDN